MPNNVTTGYAQKDINGLILWSTFTTLPQIGEGWYPVSKVTCTCDNRCGFQMYSRDKDFLVYTEEFKFSESGSTQLTFHYDTIPTKFVVYVNNVKVHDTGFGGLPSYQPFLDNYLTNLGLPPESIIPNPSTSHVETLSPSDTLKVEVYCLQPPYSQYHYVVGCIGDIDCVMSPWGAWSEWVDNGDGTKTRTRTRTIIRPAEGTGTPCGPTIDTQTVVADIDCVLSEWSEWSSWEDNGDGTETRTRTRSVVTPPSGDGVECGPLFETETRPAAVDCVVSEWSDWSPWEDNGDGTETRVRTRTVITPPSHGGSACGPLSETQTRPIQECEVSDWSAWSDYDVDPDDPSQLCRVRTRTVLIPPSENAPPCPPLEDWDCITGYYDRLTVSFLTNETPFNIFDVNIGNTYTTLVNGGAFELQTATPEDFTENNYIYPTVNISFDTDLTPNTTTLTITDDLSNVLYTGLLTSTSFNDTFVLGSGVQTLTLEFTQ